MNKRFLIICSCIIFSLALPVLVSAEKNSQHNNIFPNNYNYSPIVVAYPMRYPLVELMCSAPQLPTKLNKNYSVNYTLSWTQQYMPVYSPINVSCTINYQIYLKNRNIDKNLKNISVTSSIIVYPSTSYPPIGSTPKH